MARRVLGRRARILALLGLCLVLPVTAGDASEVARPQVPAEVEEYVLKSAFLYNFAKYVEWPQDAFGAPEDPIVLGIVGSDPFGPSLEHSLAEKTVRNRRFVVRRFRTPEDVQSCHVLFVARVEPAGLAAILDRVRERPVLTVGEQPGFCQAGGTISIAIQKGAPRLEVNPDAAAQAGLTIDARLLKLATLVRKEGAP